MHIRDARPPEYERGAERGESDEAEVEQDDEVSSHV